MLGVTLGDLAEAGGTALAFLLFIAALFAWAFVRVNVIQPLIDRHHRRAYVLQCRDAAMLKAREECEQRRLR